MFYRERRDRSDTYAIAAPDSGPIQFLLTNGKGDAHATALVNVDVCIMAGLRAMKKIMRRERNKILRTI